jgi:hypothetical protein
VTAVAAMKNRLNLVDGNVTSVVANNGGWAGLGTGTLKTDTQENKTATATTIMKTRTAMLFNLGQAMNPEYLVLDIPDTSHAVYDCAVYGGTTAAQAKTLTAENLVGRYTTTAKAAKVTVELAAKNVQYLFVVFNKTGNDPGNTKDNSRFGFDADGNPLFGATDLAGSTYPSGGIHVSEMNVYGVKPAAASKAPASAGATILQDVSNGYDMMVVSNLPEDLTATEGFTLKEYGTIVIPYQYLPMGTNAKAGAQLVYGNEYVAMASYTVEEDGAPTAGQELNVELSGAATVYPGVKFAARTFMLYEDANGNQEVVYGNVVTRSVWNIARSIATAVLEAKEAGTLQTTLTYTDKVTDAYTAAEAAVATSKTDVTYEDLYAFISANVDAVAEIA